ncbi:MAG: hypothetical protein ACT4PL_03440 [Phycisphaerales bacterium]
MAKRTANAEKDPKATIKVALAILCFVVAGLALAWNAGLFESNPTQQELVAREEAAMPPEQKEKRKMELKKSQEILEEMGKKPGSVTAGS